MLQAVELLSARYYDSALGAIGKEVAAQIANRTQHALDGIPKTLAAIKLIAESAP
jgi:hypothetical protein